MSTDPQLHSPRRRSVCRGLASDVYDMPSSAPRTWQCWPLMGDQTRRVPTGVFDLAACGSRRTKTERNESTVLRAHVGQNVVCPVYGAIIMMTEHDQGCALYIRDEHTIWVFGGIWPVMRRTTFDAPRIPIRAGTFIGSVTSGRASKIGQDAWLSVTAYDAGGGQYPLSDQGVRHLVQSGHMKWTGKRPPIYLLNPTATLLAAAAIPGDRT
jgi:hypothetical protein